MGVTGLVLVLLAQAPLPAPATEIAAVEIRLPAGADPKLLDRVSELVTVRKGQPLSRRTVQQSIEGLYASGRFADVEVSTRPGPEGLDVVFLLTPRRRIGEVFVEGSRRFPAADLLALTRLSTATDREYWPERVALAAETLRDFLRRRGFQSAVVSPEVIEHDATTDVGFTVDEGEPTRVAGVALAGEPGLPLPTLLQVLGVGPGDVLDAERLETGVEAIRARLREEHFYRARVDAAEVLPGGRVVVPLVAGPRYAVAFHGNRALPDTALRGMLGYAGQETLDTTLASRLAQRLERAYRFRGFHDARVRAEEHVVPSHATATLTFEIEEGAPLRVVETSFDGNHAIEDDELRDVLAAVVEAAAPVQTFEEHAHGDPLDAEGRAGEAFAEALPRPPWISVFDEAAWAEAAKAMTALYRERGYLSATVKLASVVVQQRQATARFVVQEGPQAHFRLLQQQGIPVGFKSDAVEALRTGSLFSAQALENVRQAVARELGRKGYLFATVDAAYTLDASGRNADSVLTIKAGPQVRTRRVLPVGNQRTLDDVILSQVTMVEGAPLDAETLFTTQNALLQLGSFRTVDVEMLSPDVAEPLKTVVVKVKERPRISGEYGVGYFLADGPRVVVDMTAPNLGGRAISLVGHGQVNWFAASAPALTRQVNVSDLQAYEQLGFRGNVSLQGRGLLPGNIGTRFDLVGERVFRPQFRFTRVAGVPSLDWYTWFDVPRIDWARLKLTLQLQYNIEFSRVTKTASSVNQALPLSLLDQERLRFLYGDFFLHGVKFAPTLDLRDNALAPRKGVLLQGSGELTGAIASQDEQGHPVPVGFAKVQGLATVYVPVWRATVLALSGRTGRIFPLTPGSVTPPVSRFFLGGSTSMRGFNEDQLLAQDLRARYRDELKDCLMLASKDGCTSAATTLLAGRQVPSQGGELFALLKAELRFPAFSVFDLGVFVESGNLWLSMPSSLWPLRAIAGTGLRYVTPIGPLALDVAVNLAPDTLINEPLYVVHFNIGVF